MRKWLATRPSKSQAGSAVVAIVGLLVSGAGAVPASAHNRLRDGISGPGHHGHNGGGHGQPGSGQFTNTVFASGATITHSGPRGQEPVSNPDDITYLDGHIFVGFQNGVGPQGQASTTGNADSTIVEFNRRGDVVNRWDVVGKCDGLLPIRTLVGSSPRSTRTRTRACM
jgi:hypothetical protein